MQFVNFVNLEHIFYLIYTFFLGLNPVAILNSIIRFIVFIRPVVFVFSLLLLVLIFYCIRRTNQLRKKEDTLYTKPKTEAVVSNEIAEMNGRWTQIERHANSDNPNDWRIAIVEADVMLEEMLRKAGYSGDTIGDILKGVEKSDLLTLEHAWEAHKMRNKIAHQGSGFQLNEREVKNTIELYKKVFEELYQIQNIGN